MGKNSLPTGRQASISVVATDSSLPYPNIGRPSKSTIYAKINSAVRATMDLYGAGFVNTVWMMDVSGITFIDDLSPGAVTDSKTAFKNFETGVGFVKAE